MIRYHDYILVKIQVNFHISLYKVISTKTVSGEIVFPLKFVCGESSLILSMPTGVITYLSAFLSSSGILEWYRENRMELKKILQINF